MTESTIVLSDDDSSNEESNSRPAFATKSTSSASHDPPRRNIAVKKGAPQQPQPSTSAFAAQLKNKKDLETLQYSSNFLDNFNPQNSRREKNKRRTQQQINYKPQPKKIYNYTAIYDEQGRLKATNQDICDCFDLTCSGCHFPCYSCGSNKCALRCRSNRKLMYDAIEHDGKDAVINNPFLSHIMN